MMFAWYYRLCPTAFAIMLSFSIGVAATTSDSTWQSLLDEAERTSRQGSLTPDIVRQGQDSAIILAHMVLDSVVGLYGKQSWQTAMVLDRIGDFDYRKGAKQPAESLWVKALSVFDQATDRDSIAYEGSLHRLGIIFSETGAKDVPSPMLKRVMAYRDTVLNDNSPRFIRQLFNLAYVYDKIQCYDESHELIRQVVQRWRRFPDSDPRYAVVGLMYLAEEASKGWDSHARRNITAQDSAIALGTEALKAAENYFGPDDTLVSYVLLRLGDYYDQNGDYATVERMWRRGLKINKAKLPPEHIEYQGAIFRMAGVYRVKGEYGKAEKLYKEALHLRAKTMGPGHPETGAMHMVLGRVYHLMGRFDLAEKHYRKGLEIREDAIEKMPSLISQSIRFLGLLAYDRGDYVEAEKLLIKAREMREDYLGPKHYMTLSCVDDLAELYQTWGQLDKAEKMARRALVDRREFLGENNPSVAQSLQHLATIRAARGDNRGALGLLDTAYMIILRNAGWDEGSRAECLRQMATVSRQAGELDSSFQLARTAWRVARTVYDSNDIRIVPFATELSAALAVHGMAATADTLLRTASDDLISFAESKHPLMSELYEALSGICDLENKNSDALELLDRALAIRREALTSGASVMTERDALLYGKQLTACRDRLLSTYFSLPQPDSAQSARAAEAIVNTSGLIFDQMLQRCVHERGSSDPHLAALRDSLDVARAELSALYTRGPGERSLSDYRQALHRDVSVCDALKSEIAREVSGASTSTQWRDLDFLTDKLPGDAVLVCYVEYQTYQGGHPGETSRYAAAVLRADEHPAVVDLADAKVVDSLVRDYRDHMNALASRGSMPTEEDFRNYCAISSRLRDHVYEPLFDHGNSSNDMLVVVPDGDLSFVSFAGLADASGHFIVEDRSILYVTSPFEFVAAPQQHPDSGLLLAMGNPDFAGQQNPPAGEVLPTFALRGSQRLRSLAGNCQLVTPTSIDPLPGTEREVRGLADLWKKALRHRRDTILTGREASELNLRRLGPGAAVIHVATHGYFIPDSCGENASGGLGAISPLLRSGIYLAGASSPRSSGEFNGTNDGILTAEEVASLNLIGTRWVVLSACESGLGDVATGEGVFGLRRAFKTAGAASVISSLWQIPDFLTAQMMNQLYARPEMSLPAKLRSLALESLKDLRHRHQPPHPFLWAAFVATGEPGGLFDH